MASRIDAANKNIDQLLRAYENSQADRDLQPGRGSLQPDIKNHALYRTGNQILATCHAILDRHDQANSSSMSNRSLSIPQREWEEDAESTKELVRYGRLYYDSVVRSLVVPGGGDVSELLRDKRGELGDKGKLAVNFFTKSRKPPTGDTWGQVAQNQIEALTALAKTVPEGD